MLEDDRLHGVRSILHEYVASPSLRHIRDFKPLTKVAREIIRHLDHQASIWQKWDGQRELLIRSAASFWVPVDDLKAFLNRLPGPALTTADVSQRMRAINEESYARRPDDRMQEGCLAIYHREKALGTEMPAIVGEIEEFVDREEERLRQVEVEQSKARIADEKRAAIQRLLSGADCKWTQIDRPTQIFCRINGRLFRLTQTEDKRWRLHRVSSVKPEAGSLLGHYAKRGDVTKALQQIAFEPERFNPSA